MDASKKLSSIALLALLGLFPLVRGELLAAYAQITAPPDPGLLQIRQELIWTCDAGYTACADDSALCCPKGAACTTIHGQKGCDQACYGAPCGYLCCDMGDVCSGTGTDAFCVKSTFGPVPTAPPVPTVTYSDLDTDTFTLPSWTFSIPEVDQSTSLATSSSQKPRPSATFREDTSGPTVPTLTSPAPPNATNPLGTSSLNTGSPTILVAPSPSTPSQSPETSSAAAGERKPQGFWMLSVLLAIAL